jgi:hypothetical protein
MDKVQILKDAKRNTTCMFNFTDAHDQYHKTSIVFHV